MLDDRLPINIQPRHGIVVKNLANVARNSRTLGNGPACLKPRPIHEKGPWDARARPASATGLEPVTFGFGVRNNAHHGPNSGAVFRAYPPQTHLSGAKCRLFARRSRRLPDLADTAQDTPRCTDPDLAEVADAP